MSIVNNLASFGYHVVCTMLHPRLGSRFCSQVIASRNEQKAQASMKTICTRFISCML